MMVDIQSIDLGSKEYPTLLSLIKGPPERIYYSGNIDALSYPTIAIVGSRKSTEYGRWAAYTIAKRLSEHGVSVVSGMAQGIDSWAHKGALAGGTPTIAVLGTGLDYCFPAANKNLMAEISEKGLLLTEYELGTRPAKYTFPQRNRIISGLSYATIIAEANLKSGSLITAEFAADQGREVYAVPGNINRTSSIGCNKLIADGARPIVFIDDILRDLNIKEKEGSVISKSLSKEENKMVSILSKHGELSINALSEKMELSIEKTLSAVTILEMKGIIITSAGKILIAK